MGVKKPAVIAKTAAKKRGRPVGSKNKPKTVSSEGWVPSTPFPNDKQLATDWEKLAKRLQEALAAQIKEADAYKKLWEEFQDKIVIDRDVSFGVRLKFLLTGKL